MTIKFPDEDPVAYAISETLGERCLDFDPECWTCQAWAQYDRLARLDAPETRDAIAKLAGYNFALLVANNRQPCMSGDPRDRLPEHRRREFEIAERDTADAIIALLKEDAR